jgi:hypothetical protein
MVRRVPDPCIICEQVACRCGKPPKAERVPRKRAPKTPAPAPVSAEPVQAHTCSWCTAEERAAGMPCACQAEVVPLEPHPLDSTPTLKASARDAMRARAARSRAAQPVADEGDRVTEDAIRALAPILHSDERTKHAAVLTKPSSIHARAMAWRQRRLNAQQ